MSLQERKKGIIGLLEKFDGLPVAKIAEKLAISPATVRRDLNELADEGLLIRTHGGAMKQENLPLTAFSSKQQANEPVKQAIGKIAAAQVQKGDVIFMDCGSTVFTMCPHLKKIDNLKVITNSLPVVAELINTPGITINLIGGELDAERKAIHGDMAVHHINRYHAAKAFIGIDALSVEKGLSSHSEKEAGITKAFCSNAAEIYLLCDSSKIGKDAYLALGPLTMISYLITDNGLAAPVKRRFEQMGIVVIQSITFSNSLAV